MEEKYGLMSDQQLKEEARKKTKKGAYKKTAICAQKELWERNYWVMENDLEYEMAIRDCETDRTIEDMQYNG